MRFRRGTGGRKGLGGLGGLLLEREGMEGVGPFTKASGSLEHSTRRKSRPEWVPVPVYGSLRPGRTLCGHTVDSTVERPDPDRPTPAQTPRDLPNPHS